jgi:hypothetical protein
MLSNKPVSAKPGRMQKKNTVDINSGGNVSHSEDQERGESAVQ